MWNFNFIVVLTQVFAISALLVPSFATVAHLTANRTDIKQTDDLSPWIIWPSEAPMPSLDGNVDFRYELVEIPALANKRTQQDVRDVCKSSDFALTVENFYMSGAMDWVEKYTLNSGNTAGYRERGLVSSIAYDYLGDNGFKCGLGSTALCKWNPYFLDVF